MNQPKQQNRTIYKQYTLRVDLGNFAEKTVVAPSRKEAVKWLFNNDWDWDFVLDEIDPWDALDASSEASIDEKTVNESGVSGSCVLLHQDGKVIEYSSSSSVDDPCITKHGITETQFFEIVNTAKREDNLERNISKLERLRTEVAKQQEWVEHLRRIY